MWNSGRKWVLLNLYCNFWTFHPYESLNPFGKTCTELRKERKKVWRKISKFCYTRHKFIREKEPTIRFEKPPGMRKKHSVSKMILTFHCSRNQIVLWSQKFCIFSAFWALNFKSFSQSLEQFFVKVGLNNFGNKIPWTQSRYRVLECQ